MSDTDQRRRFAHGERRRVPHGLRRAVRAGAPHASAPLDSDAWLEEWPAPPVDPQATLACSAGVFERLRREWLPAKVAPPLEEGPRIAGRRMDRESLRVLLGFGGVVATLAMMLAFGMAAAFVIGRSSATPPPPARPVVPPAPAQRPAPPPDPAPFSSTDTGASPTPELPRDPFDGSATFHPEARTAPEVVTDLGPEEGDPGDADGEGERSPDRAASSNPEAAPVSELPEEPPRPSVVVATQTPDGGVIYTNVEVPEGALPEGTPRRDPRTSDLPRDTAEAPVTSDGASPPPEEPEQPR